MILLAALPPVTPEPSSCGRDFLMFGLGLGALLSTGCGVGAVVLLVVCVPGLIKTQNACDASNAVERARQISEWAEKNKVEVVAETPVNVVSNAVTSKTTTTSF